MVLTPVDEYVVRMTLYPSGVAREPRETAVPGPPTRRVPLASPQPSGV